MRERSVAARFLLLASLLLAGGCESADPSAPAPLAVEPIVKQSRVQLASYDFNIHFAPKARSLTSSQAIGLSHFLTTNGIGEGDTVTVEAGGSAAARTAAARQAAVLAQLGAHRIDAASGTDPRLGADTIRVHADRTVMIPPGCPDWTKPEADEPTNRPSSNYGCATEANLAAMIANPADLVKPTASTRVDGVAVARGVDLYRSGGLAKSLSGSGGTSSAGLSGIGGPSASSGGGQ